MTSGLLKDTIQHHNNDHDKNKLLLRYLPWSEKFKDDRLKHVEVQQHRLSPNWERLKIKLELGHGLLIDHISRHC